MSQSQHCWSPKSLNDNQRSRQTDRSQGGLTINSPTVHAVPQRCREQTKHSLSAAKRIASHFSHLVLLVKVLPVEAVIGIGVGAAILVIIGVVVAIVILCCCRSYIIKNERLCFVFLIFFFSAESLMTAERSFEWMAVATLPRAMSKSLMGLRSSLMSPQNQDSSKSPSL